MNANKETTAFRVLTGSRLYGTATETSDFDYKAVCAPSFDDLLMNRKLTNRKEKPEGVGASDKMLAGETETEYLPLQVFLDDFFSGQTYALEVAFAVLQGKHEVVESDNFLSQHLEEVMTHLVENFLTRDVKKMMGYAVGQAKNYGLKADRHATFQGVYDALEKLMTEQVNGQDRTLAQVDLSTVLAFNHVKLSTIKNAKGGLEDAPALEVCNKTFPLTNKLLTVMHSLALTLEDYGHRVKQFSGTGADYKALSHAVRIAEQALELVKERKMTFPRPNAVELLAVKNGQRNLDEVLVRFEEMFAELDAAVANSALPERSKELQEKFEAYKLYLLREVYGVN